MLKIKQLITVSAYLKSCTRPLNSLCEKAINLLSKNPDWETDHKAQYRRSYMGTEGMMGERNAFFKK
jgi:hypothetical protein